MIATLNAWSHMVAAALIQKMGVIVVQTSTLVTRNVTVSGRRTSVRLEPDLWEALNEIATREGRSVHQICADIEQARGNTRLTSSMRTYIVNYFRSAANPS
jgi:predicted DNA-binding ribbon-helix-helix protein